LLLATGQQPARWLRRGGQLREAIEERLNLLLDIAGPRA